METALPPRAHRCVFVFLLIMSFTCGNFIAWTSAVEASNETVLAFLCSLPTPLCPFVRPPWQTRV